MEGQFSSRWYEELARDLKSGAKAPVASDPMDIMMYPPVNSEPPAPMDLSDGFVDTLDDIPEEVEEPVRKTKTKAKGKKKKKKKSDPVTNIVLALSICIFLGSVGYLAYNFILEPILLDREIANYTQAQSEDNVAKSATDGVWKADGDEDVVKEEARNPDGTLKAFDKSREQNSDIVGWIQVPNTPINYPVVQTTNNSYYLTHNVDKEYNAAGCPFMDFRNEVGMDKLNQCTIIYGHHRRNGTMFAKLKYYNDVEFYKENPVISFDTIYNRSKWVVFANFRATASSKTGTIFKYIQREFSSDKDFNNYVNAIRKRSLIKTPVDVQPGDQLLVLSTCSYERAHWRMVIVARKLREGETTIDVSSAEENPAPLMP